MTTNSDELPPGFARLFDGRVVGSSSEDWRAECEARDMFRREYRLQAKLMENIIKMRGHSGYQALMRRLNALEPYYVLGLGSKTERWAYLNRLGDTAGQGEKNKLYQRVMTLHSELKARSEANG